jgi:DNA-binding NtrC family response regulator
VKQNLFREDLFYRINVIEVPLPALRDRPGDLALLVHHFLQRFALHKAVPALHPGAWEALARYRFPGNVRELSHAIQHAVVLSGGNEIQLAHLPMDIQQPPAATVSPAAAPPSESPGPPRPPASGTTLVLMLRQYERECLQQAMAQAKGSRQDAAKALGLTVSSLSQKLRLHAL